MATPDDNLRTLLKSQATIAAIVSDRIEQNTTDMQTLMPYIAYAQTGCTDDAALDDSAGTPTRYLYELQCVSPKREEARRLVNIVHGIIHKYRGTYGDTTCKAIFAETQDDVWVPDVPGAKLGRHVCTLSVEVVL